MGNCFRGTVLIEYVLYKILHKIIHVQYYTKLLNMLKLAQNSPSSIAPNNVRILQVAYKDIK